MKGKKIDFRSGMGEFLGFAIIFPIVIAIIFTIISVYQVAMCEERLIFAAYKCGREAAMAYDYDDAVKRAEAARDEVAPNAELRIDVQNGNVWVKGNFVRISISEELTTAFGFQNGIHCREYYMMIEHSKWAPD